MHQYIRNKKIKGIPLEYNISFKTCQALIFYHKTTKKLPSCDGSLILSVEICRVISNYLLRDRRRNLLIALKF